MTKEEEILTAAEDEFFKKGYDGASTAVIAKAVGVTHAMVNYYFRSKENLFFKILDDHIHSILSSLKPIMSSEGDVIEVMTNVSLAIFDRMNEYRKFPFLLQDIARTHPEFLQRYESTFNTVCRESIEQHSQRLGKYIEEGTLAQCTMRGICDTVLTMSTAPFLNIPLMSNLEHLTKEDIDNYIIERREELKTVIQSRYSPSRKQ